MRSESRAPRPIGLMPNGCPISRTFSNKRCCSLGVDEQFKSHFFAGVSGSGDHQVETAYDGIAQLGALERHDAPAGAGVYAQGQQDIPRARSLQGDVHAHIGAFLGVPQVAQPHLTAKSLSAGVGVADENLAIPNQVQPGPILVIIGGINHHQELFSTPPVDEQIINNIRIRGKEMRITRLLPHPAR